MTTRIERAHSLAVANLIDDLTRVLTNFQLADPTYRAGKLWLTPYFTVRKLNRLLGRARLRHLTDAYPHLNEPIAGPLETRRRA